MSSTRIRTGVPGLDDMLGGGLLPGTLTVVVGASGAGKTQLGLQIAHAGLSQEGRAGIVFDTCARGDAQSHADYAWRMFNWQLSGADSGRSPTPSELFDRGVPCGEYLRVFDYVGRRVTRRDLAMEAWQDWQAELARKLTVAVGFLYGNFVRGVRRVVIDGIEPVDRPSDSIQFELFEYVYHQVVRKDADWVARDFLREQYRTWEQQVRANDYPSGAVACVLLCTARETMLEPLMERPLEEGDALSNANTVILMGRMRDGPRARRALYIPKHRGSAVDDHVREFTITDRGVRIE